MPPEKGMPNYVRGVLSVENETVPIIDLEELIAQEGSGMTPMRRTRQGSGH